MKIKNRDLFFLNKYKKLLSMNFQEFCESREAINIRKILLQKYWKCKLCPLIKYMINSYIQRKRYSRIEERNKISNSMKNSKKFQDHIHSDKYKKEQSERLRKSEKFQKMIHSKERGIKISNSLLKYGINKIIETKRKNNTFNISIPEKVIYNKLKILYKDIIYQWIYPNSKLIADFYIPSKNLIIEYQGSWIHGKHPFINSKEDIKIINKWKKKNTKYYNKAIYCWTKRDPLKRKIAKENNINYLEFFNEKEFNIWFQQQILEK